MFFERLDEMLGIDHSPLQALRVGHWIKAVCHGKTSTGQVRAFCVLHIAHHIKIGTTPIFLEDHWKYPLFFQEEQICLSALQTRLKQHFGPIKGYWKYDRAWVWHKGRLWSDFPPTLEKPPHWGDWDRQLMPAHSFHQCLQEGFVDAEQLAAWQRRWSFGRKIPLYRKDDHLLSLNRFYPRNRVVLARFF